MTEYREHVLQKYAATSIADAAGIAALYAGVTFGGAAEAVGAFAIVGGIGGALAIAAAPAVIIFAIIALTASDDKKLAAVSTVPDALAFASPGTLALTPFSPLFSPPDKPFLGATVLGPGLDFAGGLAGETPAEIGSAFAGFGGAGIPSDWTRDRNELFKYWTGESPSQSPSTPPPDRAAPGSSERTGDRGPIDRNPPPNNDFSSSMPGTGEITPPQVPDRQPPEPEQDPDYSGPNVIHSGPENPGAPPQADPLGPDGDIPAPSVNRGPASTPPGGGDDDDDDRGGDNDDRGDDGDRGGDSDRGGDRD